MMHEVTIKQIEDGKTIYNGQHYNFWKAFLCFFPVYVLLTGIIIVIFKQSGMPGLGVLVWIIISLLPFMFQKRFKEIFTRNIVLTFDDKTILVQEYTINSVRLTKPINMSWGDIASFRCSSSSDVTCISVKLHDGSSKKLSVKEQNVGGQIQDKKSVVNVFCHYVSRYNLNKEPVKKITLRPSFLTTASGTFLLYTFTALATLAVVIHLFLMPGTFMLSMMVFFIAINMMLIRKSNKTLYHKINQLDITGL